MASKFNFQSMENIRVVARFRPSSETEQKESKVSDEPKFRTQQQVILKRPNKSKQQPPFKASLDQIFDMSTTQKKLFDGVGVPMVQAVLEGYNSTIFAYGQTGSGKTFTMFGPETKKINNNNKDLGLVQRCCTYLFAKLHKAKQGVSAQVIEFNVTASFIQLYKSTLSDLLDPSAKNLSIKTDFQTDTPYVKDLNIITVNSVGDILLNLKQAFSNRKTASHKLNSKSSRSHMLLMINVEQKMSDGSVKKSKLNFTDLAGSENIEKALGKNPDPKRKREAIEINRSLTALTTSINALTRGQRPSYRTNKLTYILQDSLGGNSKTTMIVAASPHIMNRYETIQTLRFAMTAKKVKNKAKINKQLTRSQLTKRIQELEAENANLKARVFQLENQLKSVGINVGDNGNAVKSVNQIDLLKKEIECANERTQNEQERNAELEKRNIDLLKEIEFMRQELQGKQSEIDKMKDHKSNFEKEREIEEERNNSIQKELTLLQDQFNKSTQNMDKQIQRQRNNIRMKQSNNKQLEKIIKELNLQNTDLLKQNELLSKQMDALKISSNNINIQNKMEAENNKHELEDEEKNMEPAVLLLHRFAAREANDFRLTPKQRMEKTANMMADLSDDINHLMDQWLPNKMKRKRSKTLVFQIRQLIGHFNVMVNQMKSSEQSYQNDLKLDIKRRDNEIKRLKVETKLVHSLKDDLIEKNELIGNLEKQLNEFQIKNNELTSETTTQQETMFEIQKEVRYLNCELERSRSSVKILEEKLIQNNDENNVNGYIEEISDEDSDDSNDSDSSFNGSESKENNNKEKYEKRRPKMSMWREGLDCGDKLDCKRNDSGVWCNGKVINLNVDKLQIRYDGWGSGYDEFIERTSNRLAVYKSMTRMNQQDGYNKLIKSGFMLKEGGMFKTWRKRYFTLNINGQMSYYENKGNKNPITTLNVKLMRKTKRASFGKNKEFGLELHTDTRVWKFSCPNKKELAEWIQAINLFAYV